MDLSFSTNTAVYAFGAYDQIFLEGIEYVPHSQNECGHLFTRADGTGLAKQVSHGELSRLVAKGRLTVNRNHNHPSLSRKRFMDAETSLSALQGKPQIRITKREAFCQAAIELHREGELKFTDESLRANMRGIKGLAVELVENLNRSGEEKLPPSEDFKVSPSPRTLRRWLSARNELGLHGLVDNMSRRGNRTTCMSPEALGLMMKQVREYLSPEKPSIQMIHENVQDAFRERNDERASRRLDALIIPSRETVRRAIRALDPFSVEAARNGEAAARKKFRPVAGGIKVTRPLERVEIDEWTVDVMTLMESSGMFALLTDDEKALLGLEKKKKDRWTLTAAICCTTRCIVGMVLSRNPQAQAAVQVLQMITTDKGAWADAVGALSPWDMHGTPELIVFDGGAAFKSQRFRFAAEDLGVSWEMAMNGTPENRGTIERAFGTFAMDFAPRLTGHTFSSIIEKGDADPEARAALTVDDFTFALQRWVIDIYHNTPHRGLGGETPAKAWRRLSEEFGVQPPPDMRMTRLCFGYEREYRLDKTGITILGVRYHNDELAQYMLRKDPRMIDVRWHPKDIGWISVKLGQKWFDIPALDHSLDGIAAQTWLTAVRHVRSARPKSNRLDMIAVREAMKAIAERNKAAMAAASLNVEDWSDDRVARAEADLMAGVEFFERKGAQKVDGDLGHEIPSTADLTGASVGDVQEPGDELKPSGKSNFSIEED